MHHSNLDHIGLTTKQIASINAIFSQYESIDEVILYGSRAMGTHRPASDIDLTIVGKELSSSLLYKIQNEIDDLTLPYMFDVSIFGTLNNQDLIHHIQRVGKVFYRKTKSPVVDVDVTGR